MSPYNQDNLSISFGSMSIRMDHTYLFNEPNYTHYPRAYDFETSNNHSRRSRLFNFPSSRFLHKVCDLENVGSSKLDEYKIFNSWINNWKKSINFICDMYDIM